MFWLLTMVCLMTYGCVMPFNSIATGLFKSTSFRDMPSKEGRKIAGIYMGIPFNDIIVIINPSQKAIVALLLVATLGDIT